MTKRRATIPSMRDLFIGLMSGTSMDGVDGVLAGFSTGRPQVLQHASAPFPAALRTELFDGRDAAIHQIPCDSSEILIDQVPALPHRLGVPARAVLAATPDIGQHIRPAARQPVPAR